MRHARGHIVVPAAAALVLAVSACGGDDAGPTGIGGPADVGTPAPGNDATGGGPPADAEDAPAGGAVDAADPGEADAPTDGDAPPVEDGPAPGEPSSFLADGLHPIELPEPGTAVVRLAGETYVFETLDQCGIIEEMEGRLTFLTVATGELADGSGTRVEMSRTVVDLDVAVGSWHESDYVQMTVEQEPGGGMFSNAWNNTTRDAPGGPVDGDSDVLPVIRVIDDGMIAATAVADVRHPPFTREFDRAGEGLGEFAVVCG